MAVGVSGIEALTALRPPPWLGADALQRCQQALGGKLARETWKYSPLKKVTGALMDAEGHQGPPVEALPPEVALHRFDELDAPPKLGHRPGSLPAGGASPPPAPGPAG